MRLKHKVASTIGRVGQGCTPTRLQLNCKTYTIKKTLKRFQHCNEHEVSIRQVTKNTPLQ